ncbi:hypothetical protein CAPTEDRAFT_186075 [Capitella teleta]|uniref:Uncharacterized protein n=1 Tax=Capitella teleta TaxID=283909 RepID=R7TFG1_CAPTE|nr:hypothetical protein CAPTEDRAFT_186075 [Capitella teleta]|eukprot:ELT92484.1 hypothetical protein CAPTEDRAFT_186075 [Capitella teleta]
MTGEREKRAVARSKNRRHKVCKGEAVDKKVLEEERKGLEEEKMKIEEERKRLAVEKVQVEKMRNEREEEMTFPDGGMQVLGLLGFGKGKRQYLVSNEGLRKGCLPQQLMLYPGPPLEEALVKMSELFTLERSSSL